tara:strand:- start:1580 stop:1945 length:366 start_codon:yes stop_codon:yes gene_type:complete
MSSESSYTISKKVGNFIGSKCAPVIKTGGYCFEVMYKSVTNMWKEFSKEVAPEVENIKNKTYKKTLVECVNEELVNSHSDSEEELTNEELVNSHSDSEEELVVNIDKDLEQSNINDLDTTL